MKLSSRLLSLLLTLALVLSFTACDLSFVKDILDDTPSGDYTPPTFTEPSVTSYRRGIS